MRSCVYSLKNKQLSTYCVQVSLQILLLISFSAQKHWFFPENIVGIEISKLSKLGRPEKFC